MSDEEAEETVILTRRDRRRAEAADPVPPGADDTSSAVDEATIVVDRAKTAPAPDRTDAAAEDAPEGAVADEPDDAGPEEDAGEAIDDATVVVDRSGPPAADAPEDATVAVARPARRLRRKKGAAAEGDGTAPQAAEPRFRVDSFAAPDGAPAPAIYKPRPAPRTPAAPPVVVGAAAPTRVVEPGLPSVAKQAQRWSVVTLVATVGAGVVSVVGLVVLGFVVFA
ncbi:MULTISPECIES: hypothetical protein [Microbacterium]|uniref:hypothetical protein n=1 Tax=Microbacterium TaxID=33882 RepID=UPI00046ACA4B|nr:MULTISPECIES: hypothetical protein [Microbacterium]AMG83512.1 hypothetical protein AXH82_09080 [Microbacterium sp. PAMC 28756]QXE30381.1 hypothetical protein IZR02_02370 [Microbacterium paraoxydans]